MYMYYFIINLVLNCTFFFFFQITLEHTDRQVMKKLKEKSTFELQTMQKFQPVKK